MADPLSRRAGEHPDPDAWKQKKWTTLEEGKKMKERERGEDLVPNQGR